MYGNILFPIAICKNKLDVLCYYKEDNVDIFVIIHFFGHKTIEYEYPEFQVYKDINIALDEIVFIYNSLYVNSRYTILIDSEENKKIKTKNF